MVAVFFEPLHVSNSLFRGLAQQTKPRQKQLDTLWSPVHAVVPVAFTPLSELASETAFLSASGGQLSELLVLQSSPLNKHANPQPVELISHEEPVEESMLPLMQSPFPTSSSISSGVRSVDAKRGLSP